VKIKNSGYSRKEVPSPSYKIPGTGKKQLNRHIRCAAEARTYARGEP